MTIANLFLTGEITNTAEKCFLMVELLHSNSIRGGLTTRFWMIGENYIYIGEIDDQKIGVCRFDIKKENLMSEVSINMNPKMRGRGLGKSFLSKCIEDYLTVNEYDLTAKIKPQNHSSLKIFRFVGFKQTSSNDEVVLLQRPLKNLKFKEVDETDAKVLFNLLETRAYSISHKAMPSKSEHLEFVKSNPYRHWALVFEAESLAGSYYIQNDNSIGLNLLHPRKTLVWRLMHHIKRNFEPAAGINTKVAAHFYINVAYDNEDLKKILDELDIVPIQISFKID